MTGGIEHVGMRKNVSHEDGQKKGRANWDQRDEIMSKTKKSNNQYMKKGTRKLLINGPNPPEHVDVKLWDSHKSIRFTQESKSQACLGRKSVHLSQKKKKLGDE